ncbi:MAG: hypothetical protein WBD41_17765 [Rhodococcus sp. (in: high G+C Gram-positive bacteria)]
MGWVDKHGRPELVVHPDILAGKAVYRVAGDQNPPPPTEPTPKQRDRKKVTDQLAVERRARQAFENATGAAIEPARAEWNRQAGISADMTSWWLDQLAAEPAAPRRGKKTSSPSKRKPKTGGTQQKTGDIDPPTSG